MTHTMHIDETPFTNLAEHCVDIDVNENGDDHDDDKDLDEDDLESYNAY